MLAAATYPCGKDASLTRRDKHARTSPLHCDTSPVHPPTNPSILVDRSGTHPPQFPGDIGFFAAMLHFGHSVRGDVPLPFFVVSYRLNAFHRPRFASKPYALQAWRPIRCAVTKRDDRRRNGRERP
jgi:hypothetical protein